MESGMHLKEDWTNTQHNNGTIIGGWGTTGGVCVKKQQQHGTSEYGEIHMHR